MKKFLLPLFSALSILSQAQGFSISTQWPAPDGGKISGGTFYGINLPGSTASSFDNTGSQTWFVSDMNGDKLPDLVIAAQMQGGDLTCFSPGLNQYWKVYLSTGNGFSLSPMNWNLPNGGSIRNAVIYGFNNASGSANNFDNPGSQSWTLMDMNADNKPDLVVTAQLQGGNLTCFSPGAGASWKVYTNTGIGFSTTPITWTIPNGGRLAGGVTYGFNSAYGTAFGSENTGSQSWDLIDMNGDKKPDLVVTAQLQAGNVTCFSPGASQYWKVFLNNGTAFDGTAQNWDLPNGGKLQGGVTYGFDALDGIASSSNNTGSQNWSVVDMDGDGKPELVVTAQLQGGNVTCFSPGSNQYWKVFANNTTGFSGAPVNWNLPNGGRISGGVTYGYDFISGTALSSDNTGSQSWSLIDMDGYTSPELVVTAQLQAGAVTCFAPGSTPYWKVYKNTSGGFSGTALNCNLPYGGTLSGGVTYGFNSLGSVAAPSHNTGSQSWTVMDMNADNIVDLVVTGQLQAGFVTSFSPGSAQYWKIYKSDFVTGLSENRATITTFNLFPNPNNGSFTIRGEIQETITISDELGREIKKLELTHLNNYSSSVSGLSKGVYFVSGKTTKSKIIVLH